MAGLKVEINFFQLSMIEIEIILMIEIERNLFQLSISIIKLNILKLKLRSKKK